jgi:hypothetical protein
MANLPVLRWTPLKDIGPDFTPACTLPGILIILITIAVSGVMMIIVMSGWRLPTVLTYVQPMRVLFQILIGRLHLR